MVRVVVLTIVLAMISAVAIAQVSPEEALRKLRESEAAAQSPENLQAENERLRQEVRQLQQQVQTLEKQLADLRAVILAAGLPAGEAVAPAGPTLQGPANVRTLQSLRQLSPLIPDSALPERKHRDMASAYNDVHRGLIERHFDALAQNGLLKIKATFVVYNAPTSADRMVELAKLTGQDPKGYYVTLYPVDLDYKSGNLPYEDAYRAQPYDLRVDALWGYLGPEKLPDWRRVMNRDHVTIEADIAKVKIQNFRQVKSEVLINLQVVLTNVQLLNHQKK